MTGSESLVHTLDIKYGTTYSVKCIDKFGHYLSECSAVIRGVKL
jgi:hypothetical protein